MTLQIRDDRARVLAQKLAQKRKITLTQAVIQALEGELHRETTEEPLSRRLDVIALDLASQAGPARRIPSKVEIDAMWAIPDVYRYVSDCRYSRARAGG